MRIRKRTSLNAALFVSFFALGWGLHFVSPPRGTEIEASREVAAAAGPWQWSGSPYAQVTSGGVRCEGIFSSFPGASFRRTPAGPFRAEAKKLKFFEFNMENLFERDMKLIDRHQGRQHQPQGAEPKSEEQQQALARIILDSNPDVMTWVEVENARAAELFSKRFLDDKYEVFFVDGNDQRGIDVGVLVKKDLPFEIEYRTLKDLGDSKAPDQKVFSRDLPIAIFRTVKDGQVSDKPSFIILSTHYKSQRGDGGSFDKRLQQAEATGMVKDFLHAEFGDQVPVILTGDLNNRVNDAKEFEPLWRAGFKDSFDLVPEGQRIPVGQRGTHFYFPEDAGLQVNQLDGFLIAGQGNYQVHSTRILPHLDRQGRPMPPPKTFKERETRPSDHMAVEVVMEFE